MPIPRVSHPNFICAPGGIRLNKQKTGGPWIIFSPPYPAGASILVVYLRSNDLTSFGVIFGVFVGIARSQQRVVSAVGLLGFGQGAIARSRASGRQGVFKKRKRRN